MRPKTSSSTRRPSLISTGGSWTGWATGTCGSITRAGGASGSPGASASMTVSGSMTGSASMIGLWLESTGLRLDDRLGLDERLLCHVRLGWVHGLGLDDHLGSGDRGRRVLGRRLGEVEHSGAALGGHGGVGEVEHHVVVGGRGRRGRGVGADRGRSPRRARRARRPRPGRRPPGSGGAGWGATAGRATPPRSERRPGAGALTGRRARVGSSSSWMRRLRLGCTLVISTP